MFTCARSSRIYSGPPGASKKSLTVFAHGHSPSSGFPAPQHTTTRRFNKQLGGDLVLQLPVILIRDLLLIICSAVPRGGRRCSESLPFNHPAALVSCCGAKLRSCAVSFAPPVICSDSSGVRPTVTISSATKTVKALKAREMNR